MLDHYGPGVDLDSNRNEYQEYFLGDKGGRCVALTTLPPSCVGCLEIWETQPTGTLRASPVCRDCFSFTFNVRLQTVKDQTPFQEGGLTEHYIASGMTKDVRRKSIMIFPQEIME
jgi:hypothetical protein